MTFDVACVGNGPAACASAIAAAREGCSVIMIGAPARTHRAGETLPAAAARVLKDLGVMEIFESQNKLKCAGNVSAWGSPIAMASDAIANPDGPGWQIDRAAFDAALIAEARRAGVHTECTVVRAVPRSRARWLIDGSGRRRVIARAFGASVRRLDRLVAIGVHMENGKGDDADSRTLVEAAEHGWWYTSRVPGRGRIAAFLTDSDLARRDFAQRDGWTRSLDTTEYIRACLSSYNLASGRTFAADASSGWLSAVTGDGWLAVGDAAIAFDPLSSQGVFNALCTGLEGGRAVAASLRGDARPLASYAEMIGDVVTAYVHHRAAYYGAESRWSAAPFWSRRVGASALTYAGTAGGLPRARDPVPSRAQSARSW